jgi:hypothetical protein
MMKLTKQQKTEQKRIAAFMAAVGSEGFMLDPVAFGNMHGQSFVATCGAIHELLLENARRILCGQGGDPQMLDPRIVILNGMFCGFILGREYQKRAAMEELFEVDK